MEFNIIYEKNEFKLGDIISIFKLPDDDREIALFSVSDFDGDESSLNVAYIKTDSEGYDYIEEIEDEKILKKAMDDKFKVVDENNLEHDAEVITAFTYKNKDYLVYSVDSDEENSNILVSRLVKDSEGYDIIEDIEDNDERQEVQNAVKEILSSIE